MEVDWAKEEWRVANTPLSYNYKKAIRNMLWKGLLPKEWLDSEGNLIKKNRRSLLK